MDERDPVHCDINFHTCIVIPSIVSGYLTFTLSKFVGKTEQSCPHGAEWQDHLLLEPNNRPRNELSQPSRTQMTGGRCKGGLHRAGAEKTDRVLTRPFSLFSWACRETLSAPRQGHVTGRGSNRDKDLEAEISRMCV